MSSEDVELIFSDTFVHDDSEGELHVDLVRFTPPVMVQEVRVVPQDQRVHAGEEFTKVGETTPSSFSLNVYVNDSTNPLQPTFDPMGSVDFQAETAVLSVKTKTPSDMIVVSGLYNKLTLCIYGNVAPPPSATSPFGPSSPARSRLGSPFSEGRSNSGSGYSDNDHSRSPSPGQEAKEGVFDLFEPFSPVNSPDHLFDLSDEEMTGEKRTAGTGYEEFSDEEINFDDEFDNQEGVDSTFLYSEDAWLTSSASFNPYQCHFTKLESYPSITETPHEALLLKLQKNEAGMKRSGADEASRLRDTILKAKDLSQPQKWVEVLEDIPSHLYPGLAQLQKKSNSDGKEVMQKLVQWTLQCLSLETVRELPVALNIRCLKAGLRMVPSVASLGRKCAHAFIKHGIIGKLCQLLVVDHMASSLKLMALKAVNCLIDYPQGMERLFGWDRKELTGETSYQLILRLILNKPSVRVVKAAGALICKAHIYELLANLQQLVSRVVSITPVKVISSLPDDFWNIEEEAEDEGDDDDLGLSNNKEPTDDEDDEEMDVGVETSKKSSNEPLLSRSPVTMMTDQLESGEKGSEVRVQSSELPDDTVSKICQCLEELRRCLESVEQDIVQSPMKSFPTLTRSFPECSSDYYASIVRMCRARRLCACLLILLTAPTTVLELRVFSAARDLLLNFLSSQNGLLFLSGSPGVMNTMTRALIQMSETELPLSAMQPLTDLLTLEDSVSCTAQNLGLLLTYHLQVMQSLDALKRAPKLNMSDLESPDSIGALHTLYSMTLTPIGKHAVSHVLSMGDSVPALLPFVEPRGQKDHDHKLKKSSVSSRYAAVLILQLLQGPAPGDFLIAYGSRLLTVAEFFKDNPSPTMSDLYNWVHPVKDVSSHDTNKTLTTLVNSIKELTPLINCTKPGKGNSPILTCLRLILHYICSSSSEKYGQQDLKWTQAIISLFSSNVINNLMSLFDKLSDIFLPSWGQRQSLSVANTNIVCLLVTFALKVVKIVLQRLLSNGDYQYRDTRIVAALLRVHMVLCSSPQSSVVSNATPSIQALMVDILALYTKPTMYCRDPTVIPGIDKSCWCRMLAELFKHTLTAPHCFLSGLMVLSELLPLPLPVHTLREVDSSAINFVLSTRQLWVEHLEPFVSDISELLEMFLNSSTTPLQQALRRVCAQLVDLSPQLALTVAGHVIRTTVSEIEKHLEQAEGSEVNSEEMEAETNKKLKSSGMLRTLTFCAVLIQQPAFKIATLQQLRASDDLSRFLPLLLFLVQRKESTVQAKLCVMSILNALCDVFISLVSVDSADMSSSGVPVTHVSDCLPRRPQLERITSAILGHVTSHDQPLATVLLGLKIILSLCQYNTGLVHLYRLLPTNIPRLSLLLERIIDSIRSSAPPPPASLGCTSLFLELMNVFLSCEVRGQVESVVSPDEGTHSMSRERVVVSLPRPLLKVILSQEDGTERLRHLKEAIQESCKEDESLLNEFLSAISDLSQQFEGVAQCMSDLSPLEHVPAQEPQSIESQFDQRSCLLLSPTDSMHDPDFWLASPPHDEADMEPDTVLRDLPKLVSDSYTDFNLEEELKKHLLPSPPRTPPQRKRKIPLSGPEAQKKLKEAMEMRIKSGRSNLFRTRKQNTSRPPSMHVDDFMRVDVSRGGRGFDMERGRIGGPHLGAGGQVPYLHPGMFLPHMADGGSQRIVSSGSRWVSHLPPGISYQQREVGGVGGGAMRASWESRLPQSFIPPQHMKQISSLRSNPVWSSLQAYSRSRGVSNSRPSSMMWPPSSTGSTGLRVNSGSGLRVSDSWKGSSGRQVYKRLV